MVDYLDDEGRRLRPVAAIAFNADGTETTFGGGGGGGLTDTELRATPVPVSGTFYQATQPVSIATAPVLVAGTAIIGKVGIDQTTPGTTNAVSAVLTTGSAAIGKLAANSGVDIGDIDVTSIVPGTGATNAGKAVDSVAGATDTGTAALVVRTDALATLTPADGDYTALRVSSTGALWSRVTALDSALPAGTNAIGKLAANSGVDIGDIDVTSIVPGSGATNLGKAIDGVAGASDVGVAPLAVRDDVLTTLTPVDGDWTPLRTDSTGALWVNAGTGAAQYSEDAAHVTADPGNFVLAVREDSPASTAGTTGDYTALTTDEIGNLRVTSRAATGTQTSVNDTASNVTLLAANAARKGASFYNDSTQVLYIRLQATATTSNFSVKVQPDGLYELPGPTIYTGIVDGIWAADASGACRVTELT